MYKVKVDVTEIARFETLKQALNFCLLANIHNRNDTMIFDCDEYGNIISIFGNNAGTNHNLITAIKRELLGMEG